MADRGFDLTEFDLMIKELGKFESELDDVADEALGSASGIIAANLSKNMPRSAKPRLPTRKQSWRTGKHAADNVKISKPKTSSSGNRYIVVGPRPDDDDPYFYMKFHEYGTSKMSPRPFVDRTIAESQGPVISTMKGIVLKRIRGGV